MWRPGGEAYFKTSTIIVQYIGHFLPYLKIFVACKAKFDYLRKRYIKEGLADNIVVLLGIPEISSSHRTKLGEISVESG